jgi:hypothetical protein
MKQQRLAVDAYPRDDKALDIAGNASPEDNVVRIDK